MEVDQPSGAEYKLSRVIEAHSNDVKSLAITETGAIVSGSRDDYVRMFVERDGEFVKHFEVNNRTFVNSVELFHCPDGSVLIFCGRKDGAIFVYNPELPEPQFKLMEHSLNVCVLKVNQADSMLISGSWDARAVVFNLNNLIFGQAAKQFTLEGHKNSIWGVEFVIGQSNQFLTASADKTIKLWQENVPLITFSGHKDVVRCLLSLSEERFLSAGNDSTLRLWNVHTGKCERVMESTTDQFIYSMTSVQSPDSRQLITTSGEGGYLEFFEYEGEQSLKFGQVIRTPVASLWAVRGLPNGDVAVAANNGCIYLFTACSERVAPDSVIEAFDSSIASKIAIEAETKAAQEKETATINVSLDDGAPTLKLKYVKGTNPAETAEQFIRDNGLSPMYLNEIIEFIKANFPEARNYGLQQSADEPYLGDPFTSNRYVPGESTFTNGSSAAADPYTSNRYIPGESSFTNGSGAVGDPFTGSGRYIPGGHETANSLLPNSLAPIDKRRPRSDLVPIRQFYTFGYEGASAKAQEALKKANESVTDDLVLEESLIESLFEILSGNFTASEIHTMALEKALQWPLECIVPVLDVFRLSLLDPTINEYFCSIHGDKRGHRTLERIFAILISEPLPPVRIFVCRSLANAAKHQPGQEMLLLNLTQLSEILIHQIVMANSKHPLQLAASSCLANIAMILLRQTEKGVCAELAPREDVLRSIIKFTEKVLSFGDCSEQALQRLLQAIVTLMWGDATLIDLGKKRGIDDIVLRIKDAVSTEDSKNIARDIYAMQ